VGRGTREVGRQLLALALCAVLGWGAGSGPGRVQKAPGKLRCEVQSWTWPSNEPADTLFAWVGIGESFGKGYPQLLWRPFVLGRILGPDRAWVHVHGLASRSAIGGRDPEQPLDSVVVSTAWRNLSSLSLDAGVEFRLRVLPDSSFVRSARSSAEARVAARRARGDARLLYNLVGVFRLLRVDSDLVAPGTTPTANLLWRAVEVWKGSSIHSGETVVTREEGTFSPTAWTPYPERMPLHPGDLAALLLGRYGTTAGTWTFNKLNYSYVDSVGDLVFTPLAPASSLRATREWWLRQRWFHDHPYEARVEGTVLHPGGLRGALLRVATDSCTAVTDGNGHFELVGVPIGLRMLRFSGPCGTASACIEASDEYADSLEITVPFRAAPCGGRK